MNVPLGDKQKLLALAHLKLGKRPKAVSDLTGVKYSSVLKLSKDLAKAESTNTLTDLFNMDEVARNALFETVEKGLVPVGDALGVKDEIQDATRELKKSVDGLAALDAEMQATAARLNQMIQMHTVACTDTNELALLVEAFHKLHSTLFTKAPQVNINNLNAGDSSGFEAMLRD